jgi:hypothetical protein
MKMTMEVFSNGRRWKIDHWYPNGSPAYFTTRKAARAALRLRKIERAHEVGKSAASAHALAAHLR